MSKIQIQQFTDPQLVTAWQAGDLRAGEVLLRRHWPRIERYFAGKISSKDGRAVIIDLVQEVFARLNRSIVRLEDAGAFRAFLETIVRRTYADWLKRHIRDKQQFDTTCDWSSLIESFAPPQLMYGVSKAELLDALDSLPRDDKRLIELRFFRGLSHKQIITQLHLGCGESTLRARQRRVLITLAKRLGIYRRAKMAAHGCTPDASLVHCLQRLGELIAARVRSRSARLPRDIFPA